MSKKKPNHKSKLIGLITIPLVLGLGAFFYKPNQQIRETKPSINKVQDWFDLPFTNEEIKSMMGAQIIGVVGGYELARTQKHVDEYIEANRLRFSTNPFDDGELIDSRFRKDRVVRYIKLTDRVSDSLLDAGYEFTRDGLNFWKHPRLPHPSGVEIRLLHEGESPIKNNLNKNRNLVIYVVDEFGSCGFIKHEVTIKTKEGKVEVRKGFKAACDPKQGGHFYFGDKANGGGYILWSVRDTESQYYLYGNPAIEILHAQLENILDTHRDDEEYFVHGMQQVWLLNLVGSDLARSLSLPEGFDLYKGWGKERQTHEYARKIKEYGIKGSIDKYLDGKF